MVTEHILPLLTATTITITPAAIPLVQAGLVSFLFFAIELTAGWWSGSVGILSEAMNLMVDVLTYAVSVAAVTVGAWKANQYYTFGYGRIELIGAIVTIMMNWGLAFGLLSESIYVFQNEKATVDAQIMITAGSISLCRSAWMLYVLRKSSAHSSSPLPPSSQYAHLTNIDDDDSAKLNQTQQASANKTLTSRSATSDENINVKVAIVNTTADFIGSLAVFTAALVLLVKPEWTVLDPVSGFVAGMATFLAPFTVVEQYFGVIMEGNKFGRREPYFVNYF
ncbi:hypothetical protein HK100_002765 [Physocladia obscura]|uniref:Cation efflux protein transmembrane domain-containing protein n=1 Tax=Physocladia obscura TaxID=109957 RepID=A0AAD5SXX5_9FUNG|nr:hypothetical protein HK100_002765 [Physocladia obscura]